MVSTEPDSDNSRFCASVWFGVSSPTTLSIPVTGISPAPPLTVGIRPPADQPVVEAYRNSRPALNAWLFLVQLTVSVNVDKGLVFPRSPFTPPVMLIIWLGNR